MLRSEVKDAAPLLMKPWSETLRCGAQAHGPRAYAHQIMTRVEERELKPSEIQGLKMQNVDTSSRHLVPFDLLV